MLFHIAEASRWQRSLAAGLHTSSSHGMELDVEGFIHLSTAEQWPGVLDRFYGDVSEELLLLHIDEALLAAPVVFESPPGLTEQFPHLYGPLNVDAVVRVEPLAR